MIMQAVVVFFFPIKLRAEASNRMLSRMLQIESHQVISEYCSNVTEALEKDILPINFDFNTKKKKQWLIENYSSEVGWLVFLRHMVHKEHTVPDEFHLHNRSCIIFRIT